MVLIVHSLTPRVDRHQETLKCSVLKVSKRRLFEWFVSLAPNRGFLSHTRLLEVVLWVQLYISLIFVEETQRDGLHGRINIENNQLVSRVCADLVTSTSNMDAGLCTHVDGIISVGFYLARVAEPAGCYCLVSLLVICIFVADFHLFFTHFVMSLMYSFISTYPCVCNMLVFSVVSIGMVFSFFP